MKTRYLKLEWLIPVMGTAVVAAGLVAGITYLDLERKIHADEAFNATLDRVSHDQKLSAVLKTLHDGETGGAAQRLDLLLCGDILRTNSELGSAYARTRSVVEDAFRKIARLRPKTADGRGASSTQACNDDQVAAQRILELSLAGDHGTQTK